MAFNKLLIIIVLILVTACGSGNKKNSFFKIASDSKDLTLAKNEQLTVNLENKHDKTINAVTYTLDDKPVNFPLDLSGFKLGEHKLVATVNYNDEQVEVLNETVTILNDEPPIVYDFKIINTYPHDINSFTQGLEFYNNKLYESTGLYNFSKLRKIDYKTGDVLIDIDLDKRFFGEGLTILNDKLYQLTWKENIGFVYDLNTLKKIDEFKYGKSKEGWGLANNGSVIFKSDGTERIWMLNPETLEEVSYIEVYTNHGKVSGINEMEWVNGKLFANRYQKNGVAIINPKNGAVEGVIDFTSLKDKVKQHDELDVLNGIAYHPERKTLFVTGKKWDTLFEVEIFEKQ